MRRPACLLTLAMLVMLTMAHCPPSYANEIPPYVQAYPGMRPALDPQVQSEVTLALAFWRARGLTTCPEGITAFYADALGSSDEAPNRDVAGRGDACWIYLSLPFIRDQRKHPPSDMIDHSERYLWNHAGLVAECTLIFHETGHALGLGHSPPGVAGVMNPDNRTPPWECRVWVRAKLSSVGRGSAALRLRGS